MNPSLINAATDKLRSLVNKTAKAPHELSRSVIEVDDLTANVMREEEEFSERFQKVVADIPRIEYRDDAGDLQYHDWTGFGEAVRDVARSLYNWDEPRVRDRDEVRPSVQLNREVIDALMPELAETRAETRMVAPQSQFAAIAAANKLKERAGDLAEHIKRQEEMQEQEQQIDQAQDELEDLREQVREQDGQATDEQRDAIKELIEAREQAKGALQGALEDQAASNLAQVAQSIAEDVAEAAHDAQSMMSSLPGMSAGELQQLPTDRQIALAEQMQANPMLREVLKKVGAFKPMRDARKRRTKNVKIERRGIERGNDLSRVFPDELANAMSPNAALKLKFVMDYASGALRQRRLRRGEAKLGAGPILGVVDSSYSMNGNRIETANGLVLALLIMAREEKREFAGVHFGSAGEVKSWTFPKDEPLDPERMIEMAGWFFAGGTDITGGLLEAEAIITAAPEFTNADIVLMGDGSDQYQEDDRLLRERFTAAGVQVHGISIAAPNNSYMRTMCDYLVDITDKDFANAPNVVTDSLAQNISH